MDMKLILAILLGTAFGYVLQRIGASNGGTIINMLRFRDLRLMKVILFAIGVSSIAVFGAAALNPEFANFSVKSAYIGVIIGGLIFGLGFALAGYCPGTSVCALGEGRRDAVAFILGGLVGAFVFTLIYGALKGTWLFESIAGGKTTLADTGVEKYGVMLEAVPAWLVAVVIGGAFIGIAAMLPVGKPKAS